MTISDCARNLLSYFSSEERSFPAESETYPGRHDAVRKAMNDALQHLFGKGGAWLRRDERGHVTNPPLDVPIVVTNGSKNAEIPAEHWKDWFSGCFITIEGSPNPNRIRNASRNVVLQFPHDGESSVVTGSTATVTSADGGGLAYTGGLVPVEIAGLQAPSTGYSNGRIAFFSQGLDIYWYPGNAEFGEAGFWQMHAKNLGQSGGFVLWNSTADVESPDLVPGGAWDAGSNPHAWHLIDPAAGAVNGIPVVSISQEWSTRTATICHDSVSVDADVMEIIPPVTLNQSRIAGKYQPYDMGGCRGDDFGFRGGHDRHDDCGHHPCQYAIETWSPGEGDPAALRIRLHPPPDGRSFLGYRAFLLPPSISDIASSGPLPVPFAFIESIFLPIAVKKLKASPFWRGIVSDQQVEDGFAAAISQLSSARPNKSARVRIIPKY